MRLHKLHPPVGSSVFSDAHNTPLAHTLLRTRCSSLQRQNRAQLSWECAEEVFRQQLEADDDIRLNIRLFQKCLGDKKRFCADVQPGHAAARDCLVASRDMQGFTAPCRCGPTDLPDACCKRLPPFSCACCCCCCCHPR